MHQPRTRTRFEEVPIAAGSSGAPQASQQASVELPDEVPSAAAGDKTDLAQMLRDMEMELARDVDKVTTERSAFEQADKEAREEKLAADSTADTAAKIEAAAQEARKPHRPHTPNTTNATPRAPHTHLNFLPAPTSVLRPLCPAPILQPPPPTPHTTPVLQMRVMTEQSKAMKGPDRLGKIRFATAAPAQTPPHRLPQTPLARA